MTPDKGGVFDVLSRLTRLGLGGPVAGGAQYVSWIHEDNFAAAVRFIIEQDTMMGPINLAAPGPERQRDLMRELRAAWGVPVGLPATRWMAELGALAMRTTPSCCSRAGGWCRACCRRPASSSNSLRGRRPLVTWFARPGATDSALGSVCD